MAAFAALAIVLGLGSAPSSRAAATDSPPVLTPRAMATIASLIERMKPLLRCTGAGIDHDHAIAHLCRSDADEEHCFTLRLEHPGSNCRGTHWGQFCALFPDGPPAADALATIAAALRTTSSAADIWTQVLPSAPEIAPRLAPGAARRMLLTSLALTLGPFLAGWSIGSSLRRWRGRRTSGPWGALAVVVGAVGALALDLHFAIVGVWDALLVGATASAGLLIALHRLFADRRNVALLFGSCAVGIGILEVACRLALPPAPAFPSADGPNLFIADALRAGGASGFSPTQAGISACRAIYGGGDSESAGPDLVAPATWRPRAAARQHIVHLGDSMLVSEGRFADVLNRIEPDVEHVNAGIAGVGPDVYLALADLFVAAHDVDAVVMHLTPNDFYDLDEPRYPCSDWKPLLVYGPSGVRLRYPPPRVYDLDRSRLSWVVQNSPPPYVLRAALRFSAFAAHLTAAWVQAARRLGNLTAKPSDAARASNLAAVLAAARDDLAARQTPLVINIFRERRAVEAGVATLESRVADQMKEMAAALDVVTLDTWEPLVAAVGRGEHPFTNRNGPSDIHFSVAGNALIAQWLHAQLPAAIELARRRMADRRAERR